MRLIDTTTKYVGKQKQGRPPAAAVFAVPWHADIFDFVEARGNIGHEELRTRNIFTGLMVPDILYVMSRYSPNHRH